MDNTTVRVLNDLANDFKSITYAQGELIAALSKLAEYHLSEREDDMFRDNAMHNRLMNDVKFQQHRLMIMIDAIDERNAQSRKKTS